MIKVKYSELLHSMLEVFENYKNNIRIEDIPSFLESLQMEMYKKILYKESPLYVLKKNKRVEPFDREKIQISLENVSDEIKEPLTKNDIDNIIKGVMKIIYQNEKNLICSFQIKKSVLKVLKELGFENIANNY